MAKKYFFLGGLTRSGGTLLTAILNQNPNIHVSEISPICDLTYKLNLLFDYSIEYNAIPFENRRINVVKSLIDNYYSDIDAKYIIDRHPSWGSEYNISMIKSLFTNEVKILCPVRNILEILASYISIINKNKDQISFVDREIAKYSEIDIKKYNINDLRCDWLMSDRGTLKTQMLSLEKCIDEQYKKYFHLIEYDDLINDPKTTIKKVYDFLEIDYFDHNFSEINYKSKSKDREMYGVPDLHSVRKTIKKTSPQIGEVLSENIINKYKNLEFWRNYAC